MIITGPAAVVAVIYQGAVWLIRRELVKRLVTMGARELTKKNFKKSYEWFRGSKKVNTSEKNKILENIGVKIKKPKVLKKPIKKPVKKDSFSAREKETLKLIKSARKDLKIQRAKKITKVPQSSTPGIKPGESLTAYYTRMAKESRILSDKKIPKAPKKDTIIKKPIESEATKVAKLKEAPKVDRIRMEEKTREVLSTSGKKVSDATVKQSLASKAWEKAKAAMKIAGWGGATVVGGGLAFYMLDKDKVPETKLNIDLESEITEIQDKSVTIAEPEKTDIITPPITHHVIKKNIAEKLQTLDFDQEGVTVITEDHPAIPKRIPIPGHSTVITDVGN